MSRDRQAAQWWGLRVAAPLVALAGAAIALGCSEFDRGSLESFFDPQAGKFWLRRSWLYSGLLHDGGRACVFALTLLLVVAGARNWRGAGQRASSWRCFYVACCVVATTAVVGLWKDLTVQVSPWNTQPFGGTHPWQAPTASAFTRVLGSPGAHASSGFALLSLYFVGVSFGARRAWLWALPGALLGLLFAFAQHVRGAHPPSHEFWSIAVAWAVASGGAALARGLGWFDWREGAEATAVDFRVERLSDVLKSCSALLVGAAGYSIYALSAEPSSLAAETGTLAEYMQFAAAALGPALAAWLLASRKRGSRTRS